MWIKDGKLFDGRLEIDGHVSFVAGEPDPELMLSLGWEEYIPPIPEPEPPKYSKRKVILALGEGWADKKEELEAAGVYDLFVNSEYLCTDDPVFAAVYENLTDEEKHILNTECLYED